MNFQKTPRTPTKKTTFNIDKENKSDLKEQQGGSNITDMDQNNIKDNTEFGTLHRPGKGSGGNNLNRRPSSLIEQPGGSSMVQNDINFSDHNIDYINFKRGTGTQPSEHLNIFSSTRRSQIDGELINHDLIKQQEMLAIERMRNQQEEERINRKRNVTDQQQTRLIKDQKELIENLRKELEATRLSNTSAATANDISQIITTMASSNVSQKPSANDRRPKVLESIAKNPIDQWQFGVNGNLYVFLRSKAETYLKVKSFTRAETSQALSGIFSQSLYAENKALEICMDSLPEHPEKLEDRIETYKKLASELDENGGITIEPLNSQERVIDLFLRCKLILECEDGSKEIESGSEAEARLNHRAIKRMLNVNNPLMSEYDQEKLSALWNSMQVAHANMKCSITTEQAIHLFNNYDSMRVLRMQNEDSGQRSNHIKDLANRRMKSWSSEGSKCDICYKNHSTKQCPIMKYGPCEKCLSNGIQREKIKHTTMQHQYDSNSKFGRRSENNNKPTNFGPPPGSLQKYNQKNNFNMMTKEEADEERAKRNIVYSNGHPTLRVEIGECIMDAVLDSGCVFDGAIRENLIQESNLQNFLKERRKTMTNADGTTKVVDKVLEIPVRFKNATVTLELLVMNIFPTKFVIGMKGMTKLGINLSVGDNSTKN